MDADRQRLVYKLGSIDQQLENDETARAEQALDQFKKSLADLIADMNTNAPEQIKQLEKKKQEAENELNLINSNKEEREADIKKQIAAAKGELKALKPELDKRQKIYDKAEKEYQKEKAIYEGIMGSENESHEKFMKTEDEINKLTEEKASGEEELNKKKEEWDACKKKVEEVEKKMIELEEELKKLQDGKKKGFCCCCVFF